MNWGKFLFSFQGRISRKAYWLYVLASIILGVLLNFALPTLTITETMTTDQISAATTAYYSAIPFWYWLVQLVLLFIGLAVLAKRWHDQDRSGWWSLLLLIPFVGWLIVIIMVGFIAGTPGPNRFGERPMV